MPYTLPRLFRKHWCHHFHPTAKQIHSILKLWISFNSISNQHELTAGKKIIQDTRCATVFTQCKEEQCFCHHTFHYLLIYNTFCINSKNNISNFFEEKKLFNKKSPLACRHGNTTSGEKLFKGTVNQLNFWDKHIAGVYSIKYRQFYYT